MHGNASQGERGMLCLMKEAMTRTINNVQE